jgi:Tannase and feruloyl esterase
MARILGSSFISTLLATTVLGCASAAAASNCGALTGILLPVANTTITAQQVPAGTYTAPDGEVFQNLPAFCRIVGVSQPRPTSNIGFEVWMPLTGWNNKFEQVGNGGLAGSIVYSGMAIALQQNYATASTDDGTAGDIPGFLLDTNKVLDWRINAVHETAENSQAIVGAFYGASPRHDYFTGCSKGGSEAAVEMQRYPDDFDGIVGGATGFLATNNLVDQIWNIVNVNGSAANTTPVLDETALTILHNGVLDACGREEGTLPADIYLNDPSDCHFDPQALQCKKGQTPTTCLSAAQVAAARNMYKGIYDTQTGQEIFTGEPHGQEAPPANPALLSGNLYGWQGFSPVPPPAFWLGGSLTQPEVGGLVFGNLNYTYADFFNFDFVNDTAMLNAKWGSGPNDYNSINPDVQAFNQRGGKAIFYQGWGDILVNPIAGFQYYDTVIAAQATATKLGNIEALNSTKNFFRFFMVPGMGHCLSGPGAWVFNGANNPGNPVDPDHDVVAAVDRWIEKGVAPDKVIATKFADDVPANGDVAFTRPLCPYPELAQYKGRGNPNDAANFTCVQDVDNLNTDIQNAERLYGKP